ncbi:hypothetical protein FACS189419_03450 [Planctomycetales bacterium]|nr:hypothetical protein FACS189419_03450 [Planctomycetales bacterium]
MVEPIVINLSYLAQEVSLPEEQVLAAVELLDAGLPVPFIVRYRKDVTRNLDEDKIRRIESELKSARSLCERKMTILKTIDSQGKLTEELDKKIRDAQTVKRLEDLYLPFKPKKQTLAAKAREKGLEPLALEILQGTVAPDKLDERAGEFINVDKKVENVADALLGAGHIISEIFAETAGLFQQTRENLHAYGSIVTEQIEPKPEEVSAEAPVVPEKQDETPVDEEPVEVAEHEPAAESDTSGTAEEQPAVETPADENSGQQTAETPVVAQDSAAPQDAAAAETDDITAAFQALQQAQLVEKGKPNVISQNTLKKRKREEEKRKLDEVKRRNREHYEKQFSDYFGFSTRLRGVPAHRILAINRAEQTKVIKAKIVTDEDRTLQAVRGTVVPEGHVHADFLTNCLKDALHRLVLPALEREIRNEMTEYAETQAIVSFGRNLRHLLTQPPVNRKRVLAVDPGFKHGCKTVALDEFGNLLAFETVFLLGSADRKAKGAEKIAEMVKEYKIDVIAVGNGSASREAVEVVAQILEEHFADSELAYVVVNEAGASVYSVSQAAKEEFPTYDPLIRGAVSIGRRLQDPLNELVKVEPQSLGVGMYQHDIKNKQLKEKLTHVVESCVNWVGIDLNTATPAILTYIAGLNQLTARKIYEYRREHGPFKNREDLKNVSGFGTAAYTYSAGFLRIPGAANPFDATRIHPESYELASHLLGKLGFTQEDLFDSEKVKALSERIAAERFGPLTVRLATELGAGLYTVRDILDELRKPGRDPRESLPPPVFRKNVMKLEELEPGMELIGTVQNVVDFGAFIDVGLHESGFVHISQMTAGFVRDAHEKVSVGDVVKIWVVSVDHERKRITCSMLLPGAEKQKPEERKEKGRGKKETGEPSAQRSGTDRSSQQRDDRSREHRPERDNRPPRSDRPQTPRTEQDRFKYKKGGKDDRNKPNPNREPRVFTAAAEKEAAKPINEKQKQGKEALRSFGDLAQLFGRVTAPDPAEEKKRLKEESKKTKTVKADLTTEGIEVPVQEAAPSEESRAAE